MLQVRWLVVLLFCLAGGVHAADEGLLLHYPLNEGDGEVAVDVSGNGLNGTVSAEWVDSPAGKAVSMDGQSGIVRVMLPEGKRFGTGSWTFSCWVKPTQFEIDDPQNQRRVFAFGTYPDAYLVIDFTGTGQVTYYFCYRQPDGQIAAFGGGSSAGLEVDAWAHVVLSADRDERFVRIFVNGFLQGHYPFPAGFEGDFSVAGEMTFGNAWHNYFGVMDEIKVLRRAWDRDDVRAEFNRLRETFGVELSPEVQAVERREQVEATFARVGELWAAGEFVSVREVCRGVMASPEIDASVRSYAHLRIAQSHLAEGDPAAAKAAYLAIAEDAQYPAVHRAEAEDLAAQLTRVEQGLPPRDPIASRTRVPRIENFAAEVYVDPAGDDDAAGTPADPVASLTAARDKVRALRAGGTAGPVGVIVRAGEYPVTAPLELTAEDSGSEGAPTVYRAAEPGGAVFYGGTRLSGFTPVTDPAILARLPEAARGKVMQCDLRAAGVTDYGELAVRGIGQPPSPPTLELYIDGKPMTVARWPNEGFVGIEALVEPGNRAQGVPSVIRYQDERHARWVEAEDPWLFGYFHFLWADSTIRIAEIDPVQKTLTSAQAYDYDGRAMDTGQGILYYAFNLLEEIDQPGEWYLNRDNGILYLYPPSDLDDAVVELGLLSTPMVTMRNVEHVRFEGLSFDLARYNGLELRDCRDVLLAGCTVSRMAGNGIMVHGGRRVGLLGCDVHTIGRRATEVIGGDRETLTPGEHFVENCRIYAMGRIDRTYTPAIQLEGVGNRVAHNLMYDAPSSVMRIEGNDHLVEYNEVHSAVQESDDQGAIDMWRNPTFRGVVFRYNRFTSIGKPAGGLAVHGEASIRFDDAISGMLVYGNIFIRGAGGGFGAVQFNSGRDNVVDNNLFIDCKQGISGGWYPDNFVWRMLRKGDWPADFYRNELYLSRYPLLATMLEEPGENHIWRNIFYRSGTMTTGNRQRLDLLANLEIDEEQPALLKAATGGDDVGPDGETNGGLFARIGFRPIPGDQIGLYPDAYRASWPVPVEPTQMQDWSGDR